MLTAYETFQEVNNPVFPENSLRNNKSFITSFSAPQIQVIIMLRNTEYSGNDARSQIAFIRFCKYL